MTDMNQTVGRRVIRKDSEAKVTGKALYAGDVYMPDMLYGKALEALSAC